MKKLYAVTVLCALLILTGCVGGVKSVQAAVSLNQTTTTVRVGGKTTLKLRGTGKKATWVSSDRRVARVSSKGIITGLKKGRAVVTARLGTKKYSCVVTVNETYGANVCAVTMKKESSVTLTLTENSIVNYKIKNPNVCSASWGAWDGNDIRLNIMPKKVGTTYITCTNNANTETVRIRVQVTGVPVHVTEMLVGTSDGGDLVCGLNTAKLMFRQDRTSKNTVVSLVTREGEVIKTFRQGSLLKRRRHTIVWDGRNDKGEPFEGEFRMRVTADGYATGDRVYYTAYAGSPFQSGDGSAVLPYEVTNVQQFKKIAHFSERSFIQTADIDLNYEVSERLFTEKNPFNGRYEGQNHSIQNYFGADSVFGVVGEDGVLANLLFAEFSVSGIGQKDVSVVAEKNYGKITGCVVAEAFLSVGVTADASLLTVDNYGTVEESHVSGSLYAGRSMGGLVVRNHGKIIACSAGAQMELVLGGADAPDGVLYAGNIAAFNDVSALISKSHGSCSIQITGTLAPSCSLYAGGIAGDNCGQIIGGSSCGSLSSKVTGKSFAGIIAGKNDGNVLNITYFSQSGLGACATGNGRQEGLTVTKNPQEKADTPDVDAV